MQSYKENILQLKSYYIHYSYCIHHWHSRGAWKCCSLETKIQWQT